MGSAIFPKFLGAAFSITKTPKFRTLIHESASGKELRLALQAMPRWDITLTYEHLYARQRYVSPNQVPDTTALIDATNIVANDWASLAGFFAARQGSYDDFLLDDQDEDPVVGAVNGLIGTGDGSTISFQLQRQLGQFNETIQNVNGTPIQPTATWTAGRGNLANDIVLPTATAIMAQANRQPSVQSIGWPCYFICTTAGTSGAAEPNWRNAPLVGQTIQDGAAVWTNQGTAFVLYVGGTAQATSSYALGSTGLVTFVTAPAGGSITWTGDFYTRVRFAQDTVDFEEFYFQFWQAKKVQLISVKL